MYIYIYIVIHRQICFVLLELFNVARELNIYIYIYVCMCVCVCVCIKINIVWFGLVVF